jgi:hypothetical protein
MIRVYKRDNHWLMDTTTKVGGRELPITVEPDHSHLALWFELHPEDDETSSVYHDIHAPKCTTCGECLQCMLRPCPRSNDGSHNWPE